VSDVFNQDEEEDELPKRRKLVPIQYTEEERKALNPAKYVTPVLGGGERLGCDLFAFVLVFPPDLLKMRRSRRRRRGRW